MLAVIATSPEGRRVTRQRTVIKLVAAGGAITLLSEVGADPIFDAGILSRPHLISGTTMSMTMPSHDGIPAGFAGGVAEMRVGANPQIANARKALSNDRVNADLLDLRFERTTARIYTSSLDVPVQDLTDVSWPSFAVKVVRLSELGIGRIEILIEPLTQLLADERLDIPEYWALGDACLVLDTVDSIGISDGAGGTLQPSLSASFCWEWVGVTLLAGDLVNDAVWDQWGDGSTTGMRLRTDVSGNANIVWEVFGLSTDTLTSANDVLEEGPSRRYTVSVRRDSVAQTLTLLLNGVVIASAASVTGTITDPSASITLGNASSQWSAMGERRFWDIAPSDADIATNHDRRIAIPTPGLAGCWRDGAGTVWPDAVGSADTDQFVETPTFSYGFEGFPGQHDGTHPQAYGRVINVQPGLTWVANFVAEVHSAEITSVILHQRGTERADPADYKANFVTLTKAAPGLILFIVDPRPESELRVVFNAGSFTGEELLKELLFVDGPLDVSLTAPKFVDGIGLDEDVALYLPSKHGGYQSLEVIEPLARGLDAVVIADESGDFSVVRVPALDWAPPAGTNDGEQDVILTAGVDFIEGDGEGRGGDLSIDGDVPGIYDSRARYAISASGAIDPKDIDLDLVGTTDPPNAQAEAQRSMLAKFLVAHYTQPPSFVDSNLGRLEGAEIESPYVNRADALANAKRRATSSLSLGGRSFRIAGPLRRTVPGIYRLGAKVLLKSGVIDAEDGIPCTVTDFQAPTGSIGLQESRIARVQPDEIVPSPNDIAPTVGNFVSHPLVSSLVFAESTGSNIFFETGFPRPQVINTAASCQVRIRFSGNGDSVTLQTIELPVSGDARLEVIQGGQQVTSMENGVVQIDPGGDVVVAATFDPAAEGPLEDLTFIFTLTRTGAGTVRVYSVDYRYQTR